MGAQENPIAQPGYITEQPKTPEQQRAAPEAQLAKLRETINQGQIDKTVDMLIGVSAEHGQIAPETIDRFVRSLTDAERGRLIAFLEGKETDPKKAALRSQLAALRGEVTPVEQPRQSQGPEQQGTAAQKIMEAIDKGIERLGVANKLNDVVRQISERTGIPLPADSAKIIETAKNFFVGFAAQTIENLAQSFKKFNPNMTGVLTTARDLRMFQLKPEQREAFKLAYDEWAKNASPPPPDVQKAVDFATKRRTNPNLTWELYAQGKAPETGSQTQVAQNKPAETTPTPEKVEGKKDVTLADNSTVSITKGPENKVTVEVAGVKREMKFAEKPTEVAVTKPQGNEKGYVEVKMPSKTVKIDLVALKTATTEKKAEVMAGDNSTKVSLTETA